MLPQAPLASPQHLGWTPLQAAFTSASLSCCSTEHVLQTPASLTAAASLPCLQVLLALPMQDPKLTPAEYFAGELQQALLRGLSLHAAGLGEDDLVDCLIKAATITQVSQAAAGGA